MYTIGEFSKETGISESTLRYYDVNGILTAKHKKDNGYRYYDEEQLISALFISNMKHLGLSLEVIKELVFATDPLDMQRKITHQKEKLLEEISQLTFFKNTYLNAALNLAQLKSQPSDPVIGFLSGCGYLSRQISCCGQDIRNLVSVDMVKILKECHRLKLHQSMGMRIICGSLAEVPSPDLLIVPIEEYFNVSQNAAVGLMPDQKTISLITSGTKVDFTETVQRLREAARFMKLSVTDTPVIDIICDPGDVPNTHEYIAQIHLILK